MKTKSLVRYLNRTAQFDADLELTDIFSQPRYWGRLTNAALFPGIDSRKHIRLAKRKATKHSRELACKHLNITIRSAYIKDIYEELTHYLSDLIRCCAKRNLDPDRLIGDHKFQIDANTLLSLGSWENVLRRVADDLFRKLENERSTIKLITAVDAKLNLKLDNSIVEAAMPYLDMRHVLVHRDGIVDAEFAARHPQIGLSAGQEFSLQFSQIADARNAINALVTQIDERVVSNNLLLAEDLQR